jgi:hypothetical protein
LYFDMHKSQGSCKRERETHRVHHISFNFYLLSQYGRKDYDMKNSSTSPNPHPLGGEAAVNIEFHLQVNAGCGCLRAHIALTAPRSNSRSVLFAAKRCCRGMKSHISYIVFAPIRISPQAARLTDAFACRVTSRAPSSRWLVTLSN